jgi:hypothetical protein
VPSLSSIQDVCKQEAFVLKTVYLIITRLLLQFLEEERRNELKQREEASMNFHCDTCSRDFTDIAKLYFLDVSSKDFVIDLTYLELRTFSMQRMLG